jgi:hypothetical protein
MGMSDPVLKVVDVDIEQGRWLVLQDDSRWGIAPDDAVDPAVWRPGTEVTVNRSSDPDYPWAIVRLDSAGTDVVRAEDLT